MLIKNLMHLKLSFLLIKYNFVTNNVLLKKNYFFNRYKLKNQNFKVTENI